MAGLPHISFQLTAQQAAQPMTPAMFNALQQQVSSWAQTETDREILEQLHAVEDAERLRREQEYRASGAPWRWPDPEDWAVGYEYSGIRTRQVWPDANGVRHWVWQRDHLPGIKADAWTCIRRAMLVLPRLDPKDPGSLREFKDVVWAIVRNAEARLSKGVEFGVQFVTWASGFGQFFVQVILQPKGELASDWLRLDEFGEPYDPPRGHTAEFLTVAIEESFLDGISARRRRRGPEQSDWDDWLFDPDE